jgi:fluoroacetyl-CoA thioesterase
MKASLKPGLEHEFTFVVPENKIVPALYPESPEFQEMPHVFATGFLVGLIEWTCIMALNPHLDWPDEQSVGTKIEIDHTAATPPGLEVTTSVRLTEVDRRRLVFDVTAHDGVDTISKGVHERFVIDASAFNQKVGIKRG